MKLVLVRLEDKPDRTLGRLLAFDRNIQVGAWWTLELPDKGNKRNVSRIPAGVYPVSAEKHERLGHVLRVHSVPGRDGILVHAGNYPRHTQGCILVGMMLVDIDHDGQPDTARSSIAMSEIHGLIEPVTDALLIVIDSAITS